MFYHVLSFFFYYIMFYHVYIYIYMYVSCFIMFYHVYIYIYVYVSCFIMFYHVLSWFFTFYRWFSHSNDPRSARTRWTRREGISISAQTQHRWRTGSLPRDLLGWLTGERCCDVSHVLFPLQQPPFNSPWEFDIGWPLKDIQRMTEPW